MTHNIQSSFRSFRFATLGLATVITLLSACSKEPAVSEISGNTLNQAHQVAGDRGNTIVDIAVSNPDFSALVAAVLKTNVAGFLSGSQLNATVFAPNNAAFAQLPYPFDNAQDISSISDPATINTLRQILQYHVALGKYTATDLVNGGYKTYKSAATPNDNLLYVGRDAAGNVFINGNTKVIAANIAASNGIIHVVDKVLFFPSKDIAQIAIGNGSFKALVAALQKTGLIGAVTQPGNNLTVFAPTDAAFAQLPAPLNNAANIKGITDQATIDQLRKVLAYHVIGARVFSADLREGIKPATLIGETVTINLAGGAKVKGNGNATGSNIVLTDLLARNGVIHVIDQVLLP
jgi:uncharacterized surface protein with fasciclin (FAS1) repeats